MARSRSGTDYLRQLLSLLPRGPAWSREPGSRTYEFYDSISEELARVENRAQTLVKERDTRYTSELIDEHEKDLGIPEGCIVDGIPFSPVMTLSERRKRARAKLLASGQQNKDYFIEVAENYGFSSDITEFSPGWCGLLLCGEPIGEFDSLFYWSFDVNFSGDISEFLCGEGVCNQSLRKVTDLLEAVFCYADIYKPAHTILIKNIIGPPFDEAFDLSFHSRPSSTEMVDGNFSRAFSSAFSRFLGGHFNYDSFSTDFNRPL